MKRILIPTDFSVHAVTAARLGMQLAARTGAHVSLLHALHLFEHAAVPPAAAELYRSTAVQRRRTQLDATRTALLEDVDGIGIETILRVEEPVAGVLGFAEAWDADLIVMGTRGAGRGDRFLVGSVASRIARAARCPVLATYSDHADRIPDDGRFRRPLVAVDYSKFSATAIRLASALAAPAARVEMM